MSLLTKVCAKCHQELPEAIFGRLLNGKLKSYCRPCCVKINIASDRRCVERVKKTRRKIKLRVRYGATPEGIERQRTVQNNQCAICKDTFEYGYHIDHDHKTRKLRGLLCAHCNHGIGSLREKIENFQMAIKYLKSNGVWDMVPKQ